MNVADIEDLVREQGFEGDVDLLSIDIDGIDYWLWKRMDFVNPRVVVVEYQDILGPERAWSIPYSSNFTWKSNLGPDYGGASLMAFIKLGRQKGYRFIGCQSLGFNAFFLRRDVGAELFPEVTPEESGCFDVPKVRDGMRDRFPRVKDLDWVKV